MKRLWSTLVLLVLFLGTSSCSKDSGTQPANAAYPAPATLTQAQVVSPAPITPTMIVQPQPTHRAYPTAWRDFTPTPNLTPGVWPEFSSEFTYLNPFDGTVMGPIRYSIRYPQDWYLYPGLTTLMPGLEWQFTYVQNYEQINNNPDEPEVAPGKVKLTLFAWPCLKAIGKACPTDLPLLSPGLPGTQEITYHDDYWTVWKTYLYTDKFQFGLSASMAGTPEENADLIKTLDKILATVVLR